MLWIIVIAFFAFLLYLSNRTSENHTSWRQGFEGLKFSSDEFYKAVEDAMVKREIPGILFRRVKYSESGVTGANREYLHVARGEYIYDICAAPFGTGFFVSYWYAENPGFIKKLLRTIPLFAGIMGSKTYFQIDTHVMFKSFVHGSVMEAIDVMTTSKGVRTLGEYERRLPGNKK